MKIVQYTLLFFLISTLSFAQKKSLTLEDAVIGRSSYLRPESPRSLQWQDSKHYVLVENDTLFQYSVPKNQKEVLLTLSDLTKAESNQEEWSFSSFPSFSFVNSNTIRFWKSRQMILFNLADKRIDQKLSLPETAQNIDFCDASLSLAYTKGQNLYIKNAQGEKQITFDTAEGVLNGHYVHRREFGISKGIFFSSTGTKIAFYRKDESMVKDYPLVDYMARQAEHKPVKYPMAGMTSHQVTVGIYDMTTGKTHFLNTGQPDDHYLTNISWGPQDEFIYLAELNREQNHMQLNQYAVASGEKLKTLFEETSTTYVEPQHPIVFSEKNPEQFYYWSRKDGWFHLYLYDTTGKQIKQITHGNWEVTDFYGADNQFVYIQATKENPTERHLYRVKISNGVMTRLDEAAGTHRGSFSPDKNYLIDNWSANAVPGKADLLATNGRFVSNIHTAEDLAADYAFGKNEIFTIKAADDSTDLYCRMILPPNFDSSKKYPAIIYVYGGPHAQLVNNTWHNAVSWWQYYMASNGYILFTVDSRGSANRGEAFENVIHRKLGLTETEDQMEGANYLMNLPYVDADRIGVHGWSYGGFMTLNLMLRHPETFKVGVSGGPVVDWSMYEVMYGERYMDTPQENPEGYQETNMVNHVENLQGKLLLIHGAQDETVVMQHSMKFLRECVKQNKPVDFFPYPIHEHNVYGKDRLHLMNKISQYFFDYL
ncbi:DPP IV N-terminal domain-containing protein [uncultured Sunxiuqinia sp.]|uniref:S9 family peptidase n=1 Tax=uncultured Sunxiuqinia sp. TaxID=1573825 RepID=UPI002606FE12|nr:DPP IV N-terminal domain-containing protein [uncultured Sunxiuqinia sp.]